MTRNVLEHLQKDLSLLKTSSKTLIRSYDLCNKIGNKEVYSFEELSHLEALTNRFSRMVGHLLLKIFRLIDELDLETPGTVRDRLNRAEKKGIISNTDTFTSIRLLRNEIAHEYMPAAIQKIYQ